MEISCFDWMIKVIYIRETEVQPVFILPVIDGLILAKTLWLRSVSLLCIRVGERKKVLKAIQKRRLLKQKNVVYFMLPFYK
jgi:hypothetical protein